MRILAAFGCIAALTNADSTFDEEEMSFEQMLKKDWEVARQLSGGNGTTAAPSSSSSSTAAPSSSSSSTAAPSSSSSSTAAPSSSSSTAAPTTVVTSPPTVAKAPSPNNTCSGAECEESAASVTQTVRYAGRPPAGLRPARVLRRLRRLSADKIKAYNFYCAAYGAASSASMCKGLHTAGQIDQTKFNNYQALFPDYKTCAPSMVNPLTGTADCHVGTTGYCIVNPVNKAQVTEHKVCTSDTDLGGGNFNYNVQSTLTMPKSFAADATSFQADMNTAKTSAAAAASTTAATDALKSYMVGAAALIKQNTALNASEMFGIDDSVLDQVASGMASGTLDLAAVAAGSGTKPTYLTTAEGALTVTINAPTVVAATTASSGAFSTTVAASVLVGAVSALLF